MEIGTITTLVGALARALLGMKNMCDQHKISKSEIQELDTFIQDLKQYTPALTKQFTECGRDNLAIIALNELEKDINKVIVKLNKWSTDGSFLRILKARDRNVKLQNMHMKVMESISKNLGIAGLSVQFGVRALITEQGTEMKALLTACIESVQGRMIQEVRAQVVEAKQYEFADVKFWEDVLAAVDSRHDALYVSRDELSNLYEDPITADLMIDPVVASNGETYCRWTIIDKDMDRNPLNSPEALTIVVDNMATRRELHVAFPEQQEKFQQRRQQYRFQALLWESDGMLADAEVALQNVLRWDKNDKECAELLVKVQRALGEAKKKYTERSPLTDQGIESTQDRGYADGDVITRQTKPSSEKDRGVLTKAKDFIPGPDPCQSKTPQPQRPSNAYPVLSYQSSGGPEVRLPPVSRSQELKKESASSSQGDRNGSEENEVYQTRAPPPGSYQDDDTGPSKKHLVMAVMEVESAVNHFAKVLISDMNTYPEGLKQMKQAIIRELHSEVDRANHWKFLVQAFVCKRLFEDFEAENGFFGIQQFAGLTMSNFVSFADFSNFKDKAVTISRLLAKDAPEKSFLGLFCFKKFKSISGDLASNQAWPPYAEDWRIIDEERHPQSEFYQSFLKIGVSVWLLHRLAWSFEQGWRMLGWDTFAQFSKFERKSMESVVPGGFEEDDEETGTDVNTVVGFVVIPGFQVSKSVVKCEVYLRNLSNINSGRGMQASKVPSRERSFEKSFSDKTSASNINSGRIMEVSEVPARERSLEKSFSDKTSASFQTPRSSLPGGSFRAGENMAGGGDFRGFDSYQAPPDAQAGGSFRTIDMYGARGSYQSPDKMYSERSPLILQTPDSAKSSSAHSGPFPSTKASAESKYWSSGQTQVAVSGVPINSTNNQGKSGQLDIEGRNRISQKFLAPAMAPSSAKQSRPERGPSRDNFLSRHRREENLNRRYGGSTH